MARKKKENTLDELVVNNGAVLDETNTKIVINGGGLAYDDNAIICGESIEIKTADEVILDKASAVEYAKNTVKESNDRDAKARFDKMSDNEKIKNYVCEMEYYTQVNDFFHKNGFDMSGKQKRMLKRNIDRAWKNGKIHIPQKTREEILYELSKLQGSGNNTAANEAFVGPNQSGTSANIASVFNRL